MNEVPDAELAEHLGEILRRAEAGEELVVTIDGRPAARSPDSAPPPTRGRGR